MSVVLESLSGFPSDSPAGTPLIGWQNVAASSAGAFFGTTTTEADGYPAQNLGNPATHLKWVGGVNTGTEVISISPNTTSEIDYVAVAGHNWGTLQVPITIAFGPAYAAPAPNCLLHFDGNLTDSSLTGAHVFTAVGGAVTNGVAKFGTFALDTQGTGDYLTGDAGADFSFGTGDFTIDCWVNWTDRTTGTGFQTIWDFRASGTNVQQALYKNNGHQLTYRANGSDRITGTTALANATWYHIAVTRFSGTTRMFLNGVQEGANYTDSQNYSVGASRPTIAGDGNAAGTLSVNGRTDEFRVIKGTAVWQTSTSFTPPTSACSSSAVAAGTTLSTTLTNDDPTIFRFFPRSGITVISISLAASGSSPPEAAVIYVGKLLVLERSITIGRGHVPITYGRRTNIVNGMSESGNFLGRIVLGEYRESRAEFEWFTPDFYRSDIDAFLDAAQENPFFWAWSPDEYPDEVGYVWLTNNAEPETDPATRRVALELQMRGIA